MKFFRLSQIGFHCWVIGHITFQDHEFLPIFQYWLEDNCIQNFHLGRYIVGYTVGNLVLRQCVSGAVKRDFGAFIRRYTSPNENYVYGFPHSNALLKCFFQKDNKNVVASTCSGCQLQKSSFQQSELPRPFQWNLELGRDFPSSLT